MCLLEMFGKKKKTIETNNHPGVCNTTTTTTTRKDASGKIVETSTVTSSFSKHSSVEFGGLATQLSPRKTSFLENGDFAPSTRDWLLTDARPFQPSQLGGLKPPSARGFSLPKITEPNTSSRPLEWLKADARSFEPSQRQRSAFDKPIHNYKSSLSVRNAKAAEPAKPITNSKALPSTNAFENLPTQSPIVNQQPKDKPLKVKKTNKFHDDPNGKVPTYSTRSKRRGCLLIINNIEFSDKRRRAGAKIDEDNMMELFRQMGFIVRSCRNKTKKETERIIKEHANRRDFKDVDISVTMIMSHGNRIGDETHIETIDGDTITSEWVVQQFSSKNASYLQGKPKIFIFQCCRGGEEDIQTDSNIFQKPRAQEDILIAYATVPGFVAYRDTNSGSWYINRIRDVFMEHAHDTHIEDLLKIVDHELAKEHPKSKQTSSYESRGFKKCYLNPI